MRPTYSLLLMTCSVFSTTVLAGNDRFVGPAIAFGGSLGVIQNPVELDPKLAAFTRAYGYDTYSASNSAHTSTLPLLDASWQWRVAPTWIAGVGINMEPGSRGGVDNTLALKLGSGEVLASLKLKQQTALYALAGKQLGNNWLLYGKAGYHRAKANLTQTTKIRGKSDYHEESSVNLSGASLGIGATREWENGLQLRMETEFIKFKSYDHLARDTGKSMYSGKPTMTRFNVLLGYRF